MNINLFQAYCFLERIESKVNILAVGDIVGLTGIKELQKRLQKIKQENDIDFAIVNGENSAEGMGITEKNFKDILSCRSRLYNNGKPYMGEKRDI